MSRHCSAGLGVVTRTWFRDLARLQQALGLVTRSFDVVGGHWAFDVATSIWCRDLDWPEWCRDTNLMSQLGSGCPVVVWRCYQDFRSR